MRQWLWFTLVLLALGCTTSANAEEPGPNGLSSSGQKPPVSHSVANQPQSHWYGWQGPSIVLPSAAFLLMARSGGLGESVGFGAMLTGYVGASFGSPIIHWSHGHGLKGLASLGLSVSSMALFSAILPRSCEHDADAPAGSDACAMQLRSFVPIGAPVGALVAMFIDGAVLAYDPATPTRRADATITPWIVSSNQGFAAGVSSIF